MPDEDAAIGRLGPLPKGRGRFSFAWTRLVAAAKTAPLQFDWMGGEFVRLLRTRHEYPIAASVIQMAAYGTAAGPRP